MKRACQLAENHILVKKILYHQTHYEKSDRSRAFNQFTIARELDMINAISAADEVQRLPGCQVPWRNKMAERFASVSEDELCEKCIIKQLSKPRAVLSASAFGFGR